MSSSSSLCHLLKIKISLKFNMVAFSQSSVRHIKITLFTCYNLLITVSSTEKIWPSLIKFCYSQYFPDGVASLIPAWSHSFVEIDHEIISTVFLLPASESFKKGCCQLQAKVCAPSTG